MLEEIGKGFKMKIGGFLKQSFIDYPGMVSSVVFTQGCNFRCPYCHNPQLIDLSTESNYYSVNRILKYHKSQFINTFTDGVVITGGEPTIQPDLPDFCKKVKHLGYKVKLDTNGSNPEVIKNLINKELIDYIAMDVKTAPAYQLIFREEIISSIQTIMNAGIPYEFRTTCVKSIVTPMEMEGICTQIQGAELYYLQEFRSERVRNPGYFTKHDCGDQKDYLKCLKITADEYVKKCEIRGG